MFKSSNIFLYIGYKSVVIAISGLLFKDSLINCFIMVGNLFRTIFSLLNIMTLIRKENYVPNAYIILDCSFETDFKKQYHLFLKELYKFNYITDGNSMKSIILGQNNGHNPQPMEKILYFIKQIRQIECFKANPLLTLNESIKNNMEFINEFDENGKETNEINSCDDSSEINETVADKQAMTLNKDPVKINIVSVNHLDDNNLIIVKGNLKDINNKPVINKNVKLNVLLLDETLTFNAVTDAKGNFLFNFNIKEDGIYQFYVVRSENNLFSETISEQHFVNTNKITTNTNLKVNSTEVIVNQRITLTVIVTDEENNVLKDMVVNIYDDNDKLVAQEITNYEGQITINKKLTDVKMKKFYAKTLANRKYNCSSNENTIIVNTIKHTSNSSIEETTILCGSKACVHIQNEVQNLQKILNFL